MLIAVEFIMPLCMNCKKQYPFGITYCTSCGNKLVTGEFKIQQVSEPSEPSPTVIQKETIITEIEVTYCPNCNAVLPEGSTQCPKCGQPISSVPTTPSQGPCWETLVCPKCQGKMEKGILYMGGFMKDGSLFESTSPWPLAVQCQSCGFIQQRE